MSDKPSQIHKSSESKSDYFSARHISFLPWQLYSDDRAAGCYSACQEIGPHTTTTKSIYIVVYAQFNRQNLA